MQPLKKIKAMKETLTDIKGNLKKQIKDWKNGWHITIKADQKPAVY